MAISRMQQPRQQYGLGSIVKGVKKAVKGVAKGIKSAAKSPIGKAAMLYFGGNLLQGNPMFGNPFTGNITLLEHIILTLELISKPYRYAKVCDLESWQ